MEKTLNENKNGNCANRMLANVIVKKIDYDGMGGHEYYYECCKCKKSVDYNDKFCKSCGEKFDSVV